jgi:cell division transport system permease protein
MIKKVGIKVGYSIGYIIKEGFRNCFKNTKSTFTSLLTMFCAMFLFGAFFAIGENVNNVMNQVQSQQGMEVFILNGTTDAEAEELGEKIKQIEGVNKVTYKTKQQALDSMKEGLKDYQEVLDGLTQEVNFFPSSYIVTLTDLSYNQEVQRQIKNLEYVDDITSSDQTIETLMKIANGVRIAIGVIFVLLLVISITIISNTIKLSVHARKKEIEIMKYVGATNGFVRGPFIVEGILIGLVAAVITLVVIGLLYNNIALRLESSDVLAKMRISLLRFQDFYTYVIIVYGILGIGIGIIGSSISMKKYLSV